VETGRPQEDELVMGFPDRVTGFVVVTPQYTQLTEEILIQRESVFSLCWIISTGWIDIFSKVFLSWIRSMLLVWMDG